MLIVTHLVLPIKVAQNWIKKLSKFYLVKFIYSYSISLAD